MITGITENRYYLADSCFASIDYGDNGVGQAEVIAFTGHRGACKTLLAVYEAVKLMRYGRRCLSNIYIRGPVEIRGKLYRVQSEPLAYSTLLTLTDDLRDVLILVDEINLWFSNLGFQKNGNKLFASFLQQLRKRNVILMYTNQNIQWGDNRLRWQTDLEVACRDLHFTPQGRSAGLKQGQLMSYVAMDLTGRYTGTPYAVSREIAGGGRLLCEPVRRYYRSAEVVDAWESQMRVAIDAPTMKLTLPGYEEDEDEGGEIPELGPENENHTNLKTLGKKRIKEVAS